MTKHTTVRRRYHLAPRMCRSTNRPVDPEVWFRIVHLAQVAHSCAPVAAYREQTVETALGPKGAFENCNIGALTRRVATAQVVSAAPPRRETPKPPGGAQDAPGGRTPPQSQWVQGPSGVREDRQSGGDRPAGRYHPRSSDTDNGHASTLAPEIQEHVLSMPDAASRPLISERMLLPILEMPPWSMSNSRTSFPDRTGIPPAACGRWSAPSRACRRHP